MPAILNAGKTVFSNGWYLALALGIFLTTLSGILLFPQRELLVQFWSIVSLTLSAKLIFTLSLFSTISSNFTFLSAFFVVVLALCFGVNVAFLIYYIRRAQVFSRTDHHIHITGLGGIIAGIFGIGCAACGSIVLTGLLSIFGASSLLLLLPLHGTEFLLLGVILLIFSIYTLAKKINDPLVCPIN